MNRILIASALSVLSIAPSAVFAQQSTVPVDNVGARHPNMEAAQQLSTQAYEKLVAAQQDNEFDMAGHAQKAKDLLDRANREIAAAARTANRR